MQTSRLATAINPAQKIVDDLIDWCKVSARDRHRVGDFVVNCPVDFLSGYLVANGEVVGGLGECNAPLLEEVLHLLAPPLISRLIDSGKG